MDSKAGGLKDGSASDVRDARLCACRTQTVLKKAAPVYDGKTRSAFRGGKRALRAPLIGYEAYGTHRAEKSRVGANVGRGQRREGERGERRASPLFALPRLILLVNCVWVMLK